jgi:hypothetical protein
MMNALIALLGCTAIGVADPADSDADPLHSHHDPGVNNGCIPTFGDYCSCTPQCMTAAELDALEYACDLGCLQEVDWTCSHTDDGCVVVP